MAEGKWQPPFPKSCNNVESAYYFALDYYRNKEECSMTYVAQRARDREKNIILKYPDNQQVLYNVSKYCDAARRESYVNRIHVTLAFDALERITAIPIEIIFRFMVRSFLDYRVMYQEVIPYMRIAMKMFVEKNPNNKLVKRFNQFNYSKDNDLFDSRLTQFLLSGMFDDDSLKEKKVLVMSAEKPCRIAHRVYIGILAVQFLEDIIHDLQKEKEHSALHRLYLPGEYIFINKNDIVQKHKCFKVKTLDNRMKRRTEIQYMDVLAA